MSRETRQIRPFDVPKSLEGLLRGARLHIGSLTIESGTGVRSFPDPETYGSQRVTLEWSEQGALESFRETIHGGAQELDILLSDLSLVVAATSGYLGKTEVLYREVLSDQTPRSHIVDLASGDERAVALRVLGHKANRVAAYLLLTRELDRIALRPWRLGTWLARCEFRIAVDLPADLFRPEPLTEKERQRLGLPPGTVRYVDWDSYDPAAPFDPDVPPRMYVDEEVLTAVSEAGGAPLGRMMQRQLIADFMCSLFREVREKPDGWRHREWGTLEDSLLGRVVRYLEGGASASQEDCDRRLQQIAGDDPGRQAAWVETRLDVRAQILTTFRKQGPL